MIINVDLDGVTADFVGSFKKFCEKKLRRKLPPAKTYHFEEWRIDFPEMAKLFSESGGFAELKPLITKSQWNRLKRFGHLNVLTARHKSNHLQTLHWLRANEFDYDGLLFLREKHLIPGILIDDDPQQITAVAKAHPRIDEVPILFYQPWNYLYGVNGKYHGHFFSAHSWESVLDRISALSNMVAYIDDLEDENAI